MKVEVCPFLFWCWVLVLLCSFVVPLVQLSTFVPGTVSICKIPQFKSIES